MLAKTHLWSDVSAAYSCLHWMHECKLCRQSLMWSHVQEARKWRERQRGSLTIIMIIIVIIVIRETRV